MLSIGLNRFLILGKKKGSLPRIDWDYRLAATMCHFVLRQELTDEQRRVAESIVVIQQPGSGDVF